MKTSNLLAIIAVVLICSNLQAQDDLTQYSLVQLDSLYKEKKKPEEKLPYALAMLQKGQKELDVQDTAYAKILYKLGTTYQNLKDASKAKNYLEQALKIQQIKTPQSAAYASSLVSLGFVYNSKQQAEEAEKKWLQALKIRKEVLGEKHPNYIYNLAVLATFYYQSGDYPKAERFFLQILENQKETLGERDLEYAKSLNALGNVYYKMHNKTQAEVIFLQVLNIRKEALGEKHPLYAAALSNLGILYQDMGDYEKAQSIYLQVLQIRKETLGEEHREYAGSLLNLGVLFIKIGDDEKAEGFFLQGLEIYKKTVGEKHTQYAYCLGNLAGIYIKTLDYKKAELFYLQALNIHKEVQGERHPDYAKALKHLGILYSRMGDYAKAQQYFAQMIPSNLYHLDQNGSTLGEKAKQDLFSTVAPHFNVVNYFAAEHRTHDSLLILLQDGLLLTKGYALAGVSEILPLIKMLKDTSLNELYDNWVYTKYQLGKVYDMSSEERKKEGMLLDSLERLAADQEAVLMRSSVVLKERLGYDKKRFYYKDLVTNMDKDEVAIDFVRIEVNEDTTWYYALVTQQGWAYPKYIPLCMEKELERYASAEINLYKESYITKSEWNKELYRLVIKSLEPYLKNKKTIHWSPVGLMNQVALGTLQNSKNKMLAERFEVHQYGALKDFIFKRQSDGSTGSIDKNVLLVGDIAFDLEEAEHINLAENTNDIELYASRSIPTDSTRGSNRFVPLQGTKIELESLNKAFTSNKWTIEQLQQKDAIEERVREYSGDKTPSVLHFATHGFFIPAQKQGADNPLLRSGIALAGANRVWMGKPQLEGVEDGLWTAYEIANSNLMKADLVVLSACETAKGQIDPHEGVLGLQRSFKIAGVENMLLSLWQVPDKETVELMQEFYKHYLKGATPSEALRKAQATMRKRYPEPYYWAAFILIE